MTPTRFMTSLVPAVALVAAMSHVSATPGQSGRAVTFSEDIAPILYANCVTCHRPGEAAPFSLITYEDVARRGTQIARVTKARIMPPWHAEHGYGEFLDERRLTDAQLATIGAWVDNKMPRGDQSKMPPVPQFTPGWQLGKPDLILEMPEAFGVPADGPDVYRNFAIPTGLTEDRWVRAVEFRPGTRRVVHHAIFQYVRGGSLADLMRTDGQPGFGGAMPVGLVPAYAPNGQLGGWAVGTTPRFLPDGLAWTVAKGSDLVLQLHLHPTGKPETERSTIGLYFGTTPPVRKVRDIGAPGVFGLLAGIDIPPGEKAYVVKGTMRTFANMRAYSVLAHAHYLGKEFRAIATLPDGTTKDMLWIRNWDFNWQDRYVYKEPVDLPKGTRVDVTITYDNSADNPHNPCNPPRRVQWGVQSFDEMGAVMFQMMTASDADEVALDQFNAAVAKAVVNQVAQSDTVKRLQEQQKQFKAGVTAPSGCAAAPGSVAPQSPRALLAPPGAGR